MGIIDDIDLQSAEILNKYVGHLFKT